MKKIVILIAAFFFINYSFCLGATYQQVASGNWNSPSTWLGSPASPPGAADIVLLYPDVYGTVTMPAGSTPGVISSLTVYFSSTSANFTGTILTNSSTHPFGVTGTTNITFLSNITNITWTVSFVTSGAGSSFVFGAFNLQFPPYNGNSVVCKFQTPQVTFSGNVTSSCSGIASNTTSNLTMDFLSGTTVWTLGNGVSIGSSSATVAYINPASTWTFKIESGATFNTVSTNTFGSLSALFTNYINFVTGSTVNYTGSVAQNIYTASTPNLSGASSSTAFGYNVLKIANTAGVATVIGGNLNVSGNFTNATANSGSNYIDFTTNATTMNLTGTTQTLSTTSSGNQTKFYNLTVASTTSATLSGAAGFSIASNGVLKLSTSATLATAGLLTLLSDVNGCASLAPVLNSGKVTGNVTVQRYLSGSSSGPNYRGYRLLSSPVSIGTFGTYGNYDKITNSIGATFLTGTGGTTNGFDQAGNPTIYFFDDLYPPSNTTFISGNWFGVTNLNTGTANTFYLSGLGAALGYNFSGNGYLLFFRGSRSTASPYTTTTYALSSILNDIGTLTIGQVKVCKYDNILNPPYLDYNTMYSGNSPIRGFNLLGNPYACTIDWNTSTTGGINMTNVGNTIYTLNLNGTYGTYQWNGTTGTATNNGSRYIASGQGFFVQATGASASFTFTENAKVTGVGFNPVQTGLGTTTELAANTNGSDQHLLLAMVKDTINFEENYLAFSKSASSKLIDNEDARYLLGSSQVHFSSLSSDKAKLAINRQPLPTLGTSAIPLSISATSDGSYQLKLKEISALPSIYQLILKDNYLKDSINLRMQPNYNFTITNGDTLSYGASRFVLLIRQDPALKFKLNSFTARPDFPKAVLVNWTSEHEFNYTHFAVEKSIDGEKTYSLIDTLIATGTANYSITDQHPAGGTSFYRLKMTDLNGTVTYANPIKISYNKDLTASAILIYPNPVTNQINVSVNGGNQQLTKGYIFKIYDELGLQVLSAKSQVASWQASVGALGLGTYIVKVFANEAMVPVGTGKFVKQ